MSLGINIDFIKNLDLWQYYAYIKALENIQKKKFINECYLKKTSYLIFAIASSLGLKCDFDEYFSFERSIKNMDNQVKNIEQEYGNWEEINGEKIWVYTYEGINNIKNILDKFNAMAV